MFFDDIKEEPRPTTAEECLKQLKRACEKALYVEVSNLLYENDLLDPAQIDDGMLKLAIDSESLAIVNCIISFGAHVSEDVLEYANKQASEGIQASVNKASQAQNSALTPK